MQAVRKLIGTYRSELKGVAILWVIFFHAQLGLSGWLFDVQKICCGALEVFIFLSGFGLYHSLERSNDLNGYLRRRTQRILPVYLPFCLLWLVVMLPFAGLGLTGMLRTAVGNLLMVGFFSGAPLTINWYVSALMASFLLAPLLHAVLSKAKRLERCALGLLAGSFVFGLAFVGMDAYMAVSRLPIFILGMVFSAWKTERPTGRGFGIGLLFAMAVGFIALLVTFRRFPELLLDYAMYWHPFVLITPGLCVGLAWLFGHCNQKLLMPLRLLGDASFEIFLVNAWVELAGKRFGLCSTPVDWALWSVIGVAAGLLYHLVIGRAWQKISQKKVK